MVETRACSTCGGRVDVITVPEELEDGQSIDVRIGACERCGSLFSDDRVTELRPRDPQDYDSP
jgi:hypothetical protein